MIKSMKLHHLPVLSYSEVWEIFFDDFHVSKDRMILFPKSLGVRQIAQNFHHTIFVLINLPAACLAARRALLWRKLVAIPSLSTGLRCWRKKTSNPYWVVLSCIIHLLLQYSNPYWVLPWIVKNSRTPLEFDYCSL